MEQRLGMKFWWPLLSQAWTSLKVSLDFSTFVLVLSSSWLSIIRGVKCHKLTLNVLTNDI